MLTHRHLMQGAYAVLSERAPGLWTDPPDITSLSDEEVESQASV
jgi:hypothetical protein